MAIVRLEIDIDAKGNLRVTPNPVSVADGDVVEFHVNSNDHGGGVLTIIFPGNPQSPFGYERHDTRIQMVPKYCQTTQSPNPARWPEGVEQYTMSVEYQWNPTVEIKVVLKKGK